MAGLFASMSVKWALDKLSSLLSASLTSPPTASSSSSSATQDLEDLRSLERTMRRIYATLHDAEEHWNIREESVKLRLQELKDLAYDAEDVVEEYEYECTVEALERSTRINHKSKREKGNEAYSFDAATVSVPKELAVQTRKIIERFDEIKYYSDNFTLSENDGEKRFAPDISSIRKTSSVVFESYVLESQLWNLEQSQSEVLPSLKLSYKHMPVHLKRCFVALSLFPKDHLLFTDDVLHLWKNLDLLQCDGSNNEDEIGRRYFNDLVQRSFLQVYFDDLIHDGHTMHDLIHDLACFLAGEEFFRLEGDTPIEIPRNARYVSIPEDYTSVEISNVSHSVRAIIVLGEGNANIIQNLEALFLHCKKLRALSLGRSNLSKALRDNMGSLKLLRHLEFDNRLPPIHMSRCDCSYSIRELRNLNKIRKLRIVRRGSLCLIEDANEAQLLNKKHLHSLELDFSDRGQPDFCPHSVETEPVTVTHEQLLDSLRPHYGLRELTIKNYGSQKYPNWLGNASFYNLTKIVLFSSKSQHVPTLGVLPYLKSLKFYDMSSVQRIGREFCSHVTGMKGFRSLTRLEFSKMDEWSEWSEVDDGDFPCLHTLSIRHAIKLLSLPWAPLPSLVTLTLDFCENLATVPAWPTLRELSIGGCGGLNELRTLPSLLKLELWGCPKLSAVGSLPSLTTLKLTECRNLSAVGSLPSLTTLNLSECRNLSAVGSLPSLTTLNLTECRNLSAVGSLPSLTTLNLKHGLPQDETLHRLLNCHPSLECVAIICRSTACIRLDPQGLPSLRKLRLSCDNLQYCDGIAGLTCLEELKLCFCPNLPVHSLLPRQLQNPYIRDVPVWRFEDFDHP